MRITIVCGHFFPELGYLEVHLARALAALGHAVSIVTTSAVPAYVAPLVQPAKPGTHAMGPVQVIRLKPTFSLGQMVRSAHLLNTVRAQNPKLVLCIGLGKLFPAPLFAAGTLPFKVFTLLGDNAHSFGAGRGPLSKFKNLFLQRLLKAPVYRQAINRSDLLLSYTPDAPQVIGQFLGAGWKQRLLQKHRFTSLGFDPAEFFFDEELRHSYRHKLALPEPCKVVVCLTRVVPAKGLEALPELLATLQGDFVFVLGGFGADAFSRQLKEKFAAHLPAEKYRLLGFRPRSELNAWYAAADAALFTTAAISIFEALGTGLPLLLPNLQSLSHILTPASGRYYTRAPGPSDLQALLNDFPLTPSARLQRQLAAQNRFSWRRIAEGVVEANTIAGS